MPIRFLIFAFGFTSFANGSQVKGRVPPKFLAEPPRRVEFDPSSGARVGCTASGRPIPTVTWLTADGNPVVSERNLRHVGPGGTLVFPPFEASKFRQDIHATVYRCRATNSLGTLVSRDVLITAVIPRPYTVEAQDEFVPRGSTAVLRCLVPRFLRGLVTVEGWRVLGQQRDLDLTRDGGGRFEMFPTGELHIRDVRQSDGAKTYTCRTRHRLSGDEVTSSPGARVVVTEPYAPVPARIVHATSRLHVAQGHPARLPCAARGYPPPNISWEGEDGRPLGSPAGGTLVMLTPRSGRYICRANNSAGQDTTETELLVTEPLSVHVSPSQLTARPGETATFYCNVTSGHPRPGPSRWLHDGRPLSASTGPRLQLPARPPAGIYQCMVDNGIDSAQGSALLLLGDTPPKMLETFKEQIAKTGAPFTLKCLVSGTPLPQVTWTLDGGPVPEEGGWRSGDYVTGDGAVVSYVNVSRAEPRHGGTYACQARSEAGEAFHQASIRVPGPPVVRNIGNRTSIAGDSLRLPCPVGGHPILAITWEKDGVRLPTTHRQTVYPNGTLEVRTLDRQLDEGRYACTARNPQGQSASSSAYVAVRVPPVIEPFRLPASVHMGQRLSITCTVVRGDPPISLRWERDGEPLGDPGDLRVHDMADFSSTLLFPAVAPGHRANYTCVAQNAAGRTLHSAAMVIHVPPSWKIEPRDVDVVRGRSISIDCQAEGFPAPRLVWRRALGSVPQNYVPISSSARLHVYENGTLALLDAQEADAGAYLCQAGNGVGADLSKLVRVAVHVAAAFKTSFQAAVARKGEVARLSCEAEGEKPLVISWTKDKEELDVSTKMRYKRKEITKGNLTRSEVSIEPALRSDSALYTCKASNAYGQDESKIQLIVQETPDRPKDFRVKSVTSRTISVFWQHPYNGNARITHYLLTAVPPKKSSGEDASRETTVPATETAWTLSNLTPNSRYDLRLQAVNGLGASEDVATATAVTEEEAPGGPPRNVQGIALGISLAKIQWLPPAPEVQFGTIKGYYIGYREVGSAEPFTYKTLEVSPGRRAESLLSNLKRSTRYSVQVQGFNSKGAGPPSPNILLQTLQEDPPKSIKVTKATSDSSSITLEWTRDPQDTQPVSGYVVHYRRDMGSWEESSAGVSTSHTVRGLQCATRYELYVSPYSQDGPGTPSERVTIRTEGRAPVAPSKEDLLQSNGSSASLRLEALESEDCPLTHLSLRYKARHQQHWTVRDFTPIGRTSLLVLDRLEPSTWYQLLTTARNHAGTTEAEYTFLTVDGVSGSTVPLGRGGAAEGSSYLELEVALPMGLSVVVVAAVLVLVCLVLGRRRAAENQRRADCRDGAPDSVHYEDPTGCKDQILLTELRPPSRMAGYPSPYASSHVTEAEERKAMEANQLDYCEDQAYATVKRSARPPKPEVHIYHYPIHYPPDMGLLDGSLGCPSHWSDPDDVRRIQQHRHSRSSIPWS